MAAEENQNLHFDSAISSILSGFGVDFELRDHQKEVLEFVWNNAGRDLIVQWPTGAGKSLIFQMIGRFLNKREKFGRKKSVTIVITPLNLIGEDQFTSLCQKNVSVCLLDIEGKIKKAREGESLDEDSSDDEATLEEAEYVYVSYHIFSCCQENWFHSHEIAISSNPRSLKPAIKHSVQAC